jgi:hypothetical protein
MQTAHTTGVQLGARRILGGGPVTSGSRHSWRELKADLQGDEPALDSFLRTLEAQLEHQANQDGATVTGPGDPGEEPVWGFSFLYSQGDAQGWLRARVSEEGSGPSYTLLIRMEEAVEARH